MSNIIQFSDKSLWNTAFTAVNNCNVATVGEVNQMFQNAGAPAGEAPLYGSQDDLGKRIILTEFGATLVPYLASANGTLYGGVYQLVQLSASATSAKAVVGMAAYLLATSTNAQGYVVTDESHAAALTHICGVFLNTITPGNYGFIQVHGKVNVQYRASVTATTAGGAIIPTGDGSGTFDCPTQSGNPTYLTVNQIIGNALVNPANGALTAIQMKLLLGRY